MTGQGTPQVAQLNITLRAGLDAARAKRVLHALQDRLLVPGGLYLSGGLVGGGETRGFSREIAGVVIRADGGDLTERERLKIQVWLAAAPQVAEYWVGPLRPAGHPGP
jgi:uncharacterized protein YggL (DUF469 family)